MENEKILVKGTPRKNKISWIIIMSGVLVAVISFMAACYYYYNVERYIYESFGYGYGYGGSYTYNIIYRDKFFDFYFSEFFGSCIHGYLLIIGVIVIIGGLIFKFIFEKSDLTVTDKRIYGNAAQDKRVDLPIKLVKGAHTSFLAGVTVESIKGMNSFYSFDNCEEIIKAISYLLDHGQNTTVATKQTNDTNNIADRIQRLKGLLDSGVITQEEFDAKKKQLLGL